MASTLTPNYGWVQPEVGGDATTWGTELNNDLALIDAQVYANEQATVLVGSIVMYGGAAAPANWVLCDGSSYSTTGTYAALFAVIGYAFGGSGVNFNVPNLTGIFPRGADPGDPVGSRGGSWLYPIAVANLPPHAHPIADVFHVHQIEQTPHAHADPGHTHGVSDPGHLHSLGQGAFQAGVNFAAGSGFTPAASNTGPAATGVSIQAAGAGIQAAYANINNNTTDPAGTGLSTTQNTGSGTPLEVVPPFLSINFIIRFQ